MTLGFSFVSLYLLVEGGGVRGHFCCCYSCFIYLDLKKEIDGGGGGGGWGVVIRFSCLVSCLFYVLSIFLSRLWPLPLIVSVSSPSRLRHGWVVTLTFWSDVFFLPVKWLLLSADLKKSNTGLSSCEKTAVSWFFKVIQVYLPVRRLLTFWSDTCMLYPPPWSTD